MSVFNKYWSDFLIEMQVLGLEPNYVIIIAIPAACTDLKTLGLGLGMNPFVLKL